MDLELTSARLFLRPLTMADADIAVEILTDPAVMKFVTKTQTKDEVLAALPLTLRRSGGGCVGVWCVIERATGEKLGTAVLLPLPIEEADTDWGLLGGAALPEGEIEIGYLLKPAAWGKGYATEATQRLLKLAFEDSPLEEIVAVTDPENGASQNVLKKCGLRYEGQRRAYAGQAPGFRLTRQQWRERHPNAG